MLVCLFFQQLKYKLESLLAVYFTGMYQMYITSERIPDTQTSREQVQGYNGQGAIGQDQNLRGAQENGADC